MKDGFGFSADASQVRLVRVAGDDFDTHEVVVDMLRRGFFPREALCAAFGVSQSPECERRMTNMARAALKDGVSVVAYDGDVVVGAAVNKIHDKPIPGELPLFDRFLKDATDPASVALLSHSHHIDALVDFFEETGGEPVIELLFVGVAPDAGGRGIGLQVSAESVKVAKEAGVRGVSALWTSDYSLSIGRKLGFQVGTCVLCECHALQVDRPEKPALLLTVCFLLQFT
ncbi:hypothetical protein ONE63_003615 [Megalurothrips usitatus]|uniref:N-acetyltransferase domain-containing protein n=1 Tax=Megalurothrips usitatus TaxID=439358 RepID=A0AAV7X701_9NEOP|nr:hypothetical protein ONE63_003615 [Megalurothrips usitatus]